MYNKKLGLPLGSNQINEVKRISKKSIKIDNNICMSCHMPDKAIETGAIPISHTHFFNLRSSKENLPDHGATQRMHLEKIIYP